MWIDRPREQHRAYRRNRSRAKTYDAFDTKTRARDFIDLCNEFGRDKVVARHRARAVGQAASVVAAPTPAGITLAWLEGQHVTSGNPGNDNTRSGHG
jgi:hypothetical protein